MKAKLICLPYAGAGSASFRSWTRFAAGKIEIVAPQLPGREERFADAAHRRIPAAADELLELVRKQCQRLTPVVLFGHSMSAILAYELALRLIQKTELRVMCVFVSGCPGPGRQRMERATGLSDAQFVERIVEFAGYSHSALRDPEMRELLLPTLRADVEMHETYEWPQHDPVTFPIIALRGAKDNLVSKDDILTWRQVSSSDFEYMELPGGHMYLLESTMKLVEAIVRGAAKFGMRS